MFNKSFGAIAAAMLALGRDAPVAAPPGMDHGDPLGFPELLASLPRGGNRHVMHRSAGWRQKRRRKLERQTGNRAR